MSLSLGCWGGEAEELELRIFAEKRSEKLELRILEKIKSGELEFGLQNFKLS
jgi:hypothetical protein